MRKARKRVLSTLLAAVLALGLMPSFAFATTPASDTGEEVAVSKDPQLTVSETQDEGVATLSAATLPAAENGVITLVEDVKLDEVKRFSESVTLDLNGNSLTVPSLYVTKGAVVTITDNSADKQGKVISSGSITSAVFSGSTLILDAGTLENTADGGNGVFNMGTLTIKGGTVKGETGVYNTAWNGEDAVDGEIVCNIEGGTVDAEIWGVCVMGPGIRSGDLSTVDNDKLVVNISGGTIIAEQGIAGNASSGTRAGFTVNMTAGEIKDHSGQGTGMYLPSIGVTNISGGSVTAAQAIRICAGTLNVTGGTITCTAVSDGSDLIAGGSGGTLGAIVVGKAGNGYVGDIDVNVSGSAVVKNIAQSEDQNAVYPTIVVSDKNMAQTAEQKFKDPSTGDDIDATYQYSKTATSVVVNAQVEGDIVKISNVTESADTQDGGNTSLNITGGTVTGDVINQTSEGDLNITGAKVTGDVKNDSDGAVVISEGATVTGAVSSSKNGNVAILNSTVTGTAPTSATIVNSTVGNKKYEGTEYVALLNGKGYTSLQDAVNEVTSTEPATITLLKSTTGSGVVVNGAVARNLTFDLDGFTYTVTSGVGSANTETNGFQLIKDNDITFKNGTIAADPAEGEQVKILIQNYSNLTLENVTLDGTGMTDNDSGLNYTLSNNNGEINLNTGATIIPRASDEIAMDVCWAASYEDGARVTVNEGATIQGNVELGLWNQDAYEGNQSVLTVNGGSITGNLTIGKQTSSDDELQSVINSLKPNVTINGGSFGASVEKFIDNTDQAVAQVQSGNTYSYYTTMKAAFEAAQQGDNIIELKADEYSTFTLTLDYNGGATANSTYTVASGTDIPLPKPTRTGYTFQGWYDVNGTRAGASYKVTADATLTARWSLIPTPVPTPEKFDVAVADVQNGAVELSAKTAKEGQKVTVTVTPDLGWELAQLTVADEDGDALELTENADGTYSFTMPAGDVTVHASFADAWENPFTDLSEDHWGYGAVRTANLLGLMKGIGGTTLFAPDDGLMREQAATVMWNLMGAGDVSRPEAPQADVDQSQWYAPYVNWAVDSKAMDGYDDGAFGVGDSLTREQFAAVVAKAIGADVDSADQAALGAFPDADGVSGWARATMAWAVENGVINGVEAEDGSRELQATRELTRAEMAAMMVNAIEVGVLDFGA